MASKKVARHKSQQSTALVLWQDPRGAEEYQVIQEGEEFPCLGII